MSRRCTVRAALLAGLLLHGGLAATLRAEPPSAASVEEAGKRFERGVTLYHEAAYRAALVEFERAYQIAPNATVLYNIGQTYFQLQSYAAALTTFERYLAEAGAEAGHRSEVEQTIVTLEARVGKLTIASHAAGCEVTVDDELAGTTPLAEPVRVSIGRRRVTATCQGRPPETLLVDVAAGDIVPITLLLAAPTLDPPALPLEPPARPLQPDGRSHVTTGWIVTGVLGAGAVTTGVLAILASRDLDDARAMFPVSHDDLARKSSRVKGLALTTDLLGVATVLAGGIALKLTLSARRHDLHVAVAPNGVQLAGTFR